MEDDPNHKRVRGVIHNTTRTILLAALGAASLAQDELAGCIDKLVDRGEMAEADARKLMREVRDRREKNKRKRKSQDGKNAEQPVATKVDVDTLSARIAELSQQIEELKKEKAV
jgi:polyhydroxyalkanoate synthesis regulator phasin